MPFANTALTPHFPVTVTPAGYACKLDFYYTGGPKVSLNFTSSGQEQILSLPYTTPVAGSYQFLIDIYMGNTLIAANMSTEDFTEAPVTEVKGAFADNGKWKNVWETVWTQLSSPLPYYSGSGTYETIWRFPIKNTGTTPATYRLGYYRWSSALTEGNWQWVSSPVSPVIQPGETGDLIWNVSVNPAVPGTFPSVAQTYALSNLFLRDGSKPLPATFTGLKSMVIDINTADALTQYPTVTIARSESLTPYPNLGTDDLNTKLRNAQSYYTIWTDFVSEWSDNLTSNLPTPKTRVISLSYIGSSLPSYYMTSLGYVQDKFNLELYYRQTDFNALTLNEQKLVTLLGVMRFNNLAVGEWIPEMQYKVSGEDTLMNTDWYAQEEPKYHNLAINSSRAFYTAFDAYYGAGPYPPQDYPPRL